MATFYLDTSALVKLYVPEPGSEWVDRAVNERDGSGALVNVVAISRIAVVEVAAALGRRGRQGEISRDVVRRLLERFVRDCDDRFFALSVIEEQLQRAADLATRWPIRAYDAVHLAAALDLTDQLGQLNVPPLTFVAADRALLHVAQSVGLATSDPSQQ